MTDYSFQVIYLTLYINILCVTLFQVFHTAPSLSTASEIFLEGGPLASSVPQAPYVCMSEKIGENKEKNSPESTWTRNTWQNSGKKGKENRTVLKMCSVNYCVSVKTRSSKPAVYTGNMFIIMQWHWLLNKNLWAQNLLLYSFIKAILQHNRAFITTLPVETDGRCLSALFI